jgi:hypothetical protein
MLLRVTPESPLMRRKAPTPFASPPGEAIR